MRVLDVAPPPTTLSKPSRLGELLVAGGVITPQQLKEALDYQRTKGGRLGVCLIKLGYLTEDILHSVLTRQFGVALIALASCEVEADVAKLLPRDCVVRYQVMRVNRTANVVYVVQSDTKYANVSYKWRCRSGCKTS